MVQLFAYIPENAFQRRWSSCKFSRKVHMLSGDLQICLQPESLKNIHRKTRADSDDETVRRPLQTNTKITRELERTAELPDRKEWIYEPKRAANELPPAQPGWTTLIVPSSFRPSTFQKDRGEAEVTGTPPRRCTPAQQGAQNTPPGNDEYVCAHTPRPLHRYRKPQTRSNFT